MTDGPEAATALEALQAENDRLRAALERIASFDYEHDDMDMQIFCADIASQALTGDTDNG